MGTVRDDKLGGCFTEAEILGAKMKLKSYRDTEPESKQ